MSVRYGSTTRHQGLTGEPPAIDDVRAVGAGALLGHLRFQGAAVREPASGARAALQRQPVPQPRDDVDIHAVPVLGLLREVARVLRELVDLTRPCSGTRLYRPLIIWPPPPGSRASTGAVMLNGV